MFVFEAVASTFLISFVTVSGIYASAVSLDGQTIGAFLGFFGILASTIGGVYIATGNRRTEKASVALQTLEATRDKVEEANHRLKDDRILYLEKDLADCKLEKRLREEELENDVDKKNAEINRLIEEIARLRREVNPDGR